jgi:hypothetical protein
MPGVSELVTIKGLNEFTRRTHAATYLRDLHNNSAHIFYTISSATQEKPHNTAGFKWIKYDHCDIQLVKTARHIMYWVAVRPGALAA